MTVFGTKFSKKKNDHLQALLAGRQYSEELKEEAAMQHAVATWYSSHNRAGYSTTIYTRRDADNDPAARVQQIRVSSPTFRTADGLGSGASLAAIRQAFSVRPLETYQAGGQTYTIYDSPRGIAFEIAADSLCSAVIVHKAGEPGGGSYLSLHPADG